MNGCASRQPITVCVLESDANLQNTFPNMHLWCSFAVNHKATSENQKAASENWKESSKDAKGFL